MPTKLDTLMPVLHEPFPDFQEFWKCPKTGIIVPKDPAANLEWRTKLYDESEFDKGLQQDLFSACEESLLFWVNTFVMTYKQFDIDPDTNSPVPAVYPNVPFVTWAIQDKGFTAIELAVLGKKNAKGAWTVKPESLLFNKSRDMGASWMCLTTLDWFFLFRPDSQILEMSRKQEFVDGDARSLFWKHDYIHQWLPDWMCPPDVLPKQKNRIKMHMHNVLNGSRIDGESTTKHASSGDRRLVVLMDEFAKVDDGHAMRSATRDVTPCRLINSTPAGAGTEYSRWKNSGQIKVFTLPFYEHPDKGLGRYIVKNKGTETYSIRSPWFDNEEKVRSPKEMAQEILMDDIESGEVFFDINIILQHKAVFARPPLFKCDIDFVENVSNDEITGLIKVKDRKKIKFAKKSKGPWSFWVELVDGRLDQGKHYILGIDISKGMGASNSAISVRCVETGEKVAEYADARTPPYELARVVTAAALWIGGANPWRLPYLIWESNGDPGIDFGKIIVGKFKYPYIYMEKTSGRLVDKRTDHYGFHSSREKKGELLALYRRCLAHGGIINHCAISLDEAMNYVYYSSGGIGPVCLTEESSEARKTHGDRVIADALTLLASDEIPKLKHMGPKAPRNSTGYRRDRAIRKKKREKQTSFGSRKRFDFRDK